MKLKESKNRNKYIGLAGELKRTMEHEGGGDTNYNWCILNNLQRIYKETRRLRNQRKSRDYQNYSDIKIGQNTEMSPGDFRGLAITQTPEEND